MVGMTMGGNDAGDRFAVQASGKNLFPTRAGFIIGNAAVDDGPARAIFQQPQIDMIERKGQLHAQPKHARGDLLDRAGFGKELFKGIIQLRF